MYWREQCLLVSFPNRKVTGGLGQHPLTQVAILRHLVKDLRQHRSVKCILLPSLNTLPVMDVMHKGRNMPRPTPWATREHVAWVNRPRPWCLTVWRIDEAIAERPLRAVTPATMSLHQESLTAAIPGISVTGDTIIGRIQRVFKKIRLVTLRSWRQRRRRTAGVRVYQAAPLWPSKPSWRR